MTDEQIRVAIAESQGIRVTPEGIYTKDGNFKGRGYSEVTAILPDYPNDLNAMYEAEGLFAEGDKRSLYMDLLGTNMHKVNIDSFTWANCHATARQRAEAFLRTLGKWTE